MMADTSLYIWYHADADLEPALRAWLERVGDELGYRGALLRRDSEGKTTFMEVFARVDPAAAARIETLAADQPWITKLHSPRRCEAFVPVFHA